MHDDPRPHGPRREDRGERLPAAPPGAIIIDDFSFEPAVVSVASGTLVTWFNKEDTPHTTTSALGAWDSGRLSRGATFTFSEAGVYAYACNVHPEMVGRITVEGDPTAASSLPASVQE